MQKDKSGKMAHILLAISIIPLFFFGIVVLFLATELFTRTMYNEIEKELEGAAQNVIYMMDLAYPGDYQLVGDKALELHKGEHDLTREYTLVDNVKENTDLDVTIFYKDTRVLTTICDDAGERITGSGASPIVVRDVMEGGQPHFYTNTRINSVEYFSYYTPLKNADGTITGMVFIGKPSSDVDSSIRTASYPLAASVFAAACVIAFFLFLYTRKFDGVLQEIRRFLTSVSTGNLTDGLDSIVLRRKDEFGDIGRSAVHMQQALRHTVEQDALTELYNRRSGDRKLHQIMDKSASTGTPFCVCIGDIDFFKKVNDTYGHDCGDIVLKSVAAILREHMNSIGFVARWGGEEFLLVFDRMTTDQAYESLNSLLEKIRKADIPYGDLIVKVTMTFGLTQGDSTDHTTLLKNADEKLYEGKTGGRNRVVL